MRDPIKVDLAGTAVELTPTVLARAFWAMDTVQQADFLDELARAIQSDESPQAVTYSLGEMQWCFLKDELRKPGRELANQMHMALSAFAFEFWPQKNNGAREAIQ